MPAAEVDIGASLVHRLVSSQFPRCAALPIDLVHAAGWDNTIYRLGTDLAVRLPRLRICAPGGRLIALVRVSRCSGWLARFLTRSG